MPAKLAQNGPPANARRMLPDRTAMTPMENDPLWKLRHALAGVALALLVSVFIAAGAGRILGDIFGDSYGLRVALYGAFLLYVVAGAGVLFAKVARHETRPLSGNRLLRWLASLWLWPLLLAAGRGRGGR